MKSHMWDHKCTIIQEEEEEIDSTGAGELKGEFFDRLSSNYHRSKRAIIHGHELWGGGEFFSFISPAFFSLDCF